MRKDILSVVLDWFVGFSYVLSKNSSSILEAVQISRPSSVMGRHMEQYSLREVRGCELPNQEPTAFNAKKALLAVVALVGPVNGGVVD